MAQRAFRLQEYVSADVVDQSQPVCPRCGLSTIVVVGAELFPRIRIVESGVTTETRIHSDQDALQGFFIERIECIACNRSFVLLDASVFALQKQNSELSAEVEQLRRRLGLVPTVA